MDKRIVYTNAEGGVSVVIPAPDARLPEESDEQFANRIASTDVPPATPYTVVDATDLPIRDEFRNAWAMNGFVHVDMDKAKAIWIEKIRAWREPLLLGLDIDYLRADEAKDAAAKADIVARKKVLRDATTNPAIEAATSVEELRATWPVLPP